MNDPAVSYDSNGNATVDTYGMDGASVGMNDFGQPLYDIGGVTMTAEQAEENAHFFEAGDDGYGNNGYDQDDDGYNYVDESLPEPMMEGLFRINDALGGGAANFMADQLLGTGDDRMDEVLRATNMDKAEVQSYANAVMIDLAANVGMDHNMLMDELGKDIAYIRGSGSDRAMNEMHQIITDAVSGYYDDAMTRWDNLRGVMKSIR